MPMSLRVLSLSALLAFAPAVPALGQGAAPAGRPNSAESCPGFVAWRGPHVVPAAVTALNSGQVRLTYVGHATFLIESPGLVRIVTDYNDYVRPPVTPDIVTMNHAHSTHYTNRLDPAIEHVLRGWGDDDGKPARHDLSVGDVHVRNVPTNIRDWAGGTERHGNSVFIFEIAGLCIAHLGHLHHTLDRQQLDEIGRVDVVLVPVDGSYTLDLDGMIEVLRALKAPLMVPMHYFSAYTLERFLTRVRQDWGVEFSETPSVVLSRSMLPQTPKLLVLPGH